jgi:peroxiredoxin
MDSVKSTPLISCGSPAPDFSLPDLEDRLHTLTMYRGRIVVLNFWSAECPWSRRADEELLVYSQGWGKEVVVLPVASNASEPVELLRRAAVERGLPVLLHDVDRQAAGLYGALTTPHLFVIDREGLLRYQGAFDDVTFRKRTPDRHYLREAVEALLGGGDPTPAETAPYGCTIVWYEGSVPAE